MAKFTYAWKQGEEVRYPKSGSKYEGTPLLQKARLFGNKSGIKNSSLYRDTAMRHKVTILPVEVSIDDTLLQDL